MIKVLLILVASFFMTLSVVMAVEMVDRPAKFSVETRADRRKKR